MARRHLPIISAMFASSGNLAECFAPSSPQTTQIVRQEFFPPSLQMAGRGMGGGSATKKKRKGGGGGMGGKKGKSTSAGVNSSAPFDAAASLLRNERLYDDICREAFKEMESEYESFDSITTEYLITARSSSPTAPAAVSDWVPVSQIVVVRPVSDSDHKETVRAAVSQFCRESFCAASISAPVFKQIPRNEVEYGAEPLDAFHRYVYDDVIEGKSSMGTSGAKGDAAMTKTEARAVLQLEEGVTDARDIKSAYRKKTFALHPDRFVGVDQTEEEKIETAKEFASVKIAYEVLSSGVRDVAPNDDWSNGKRSSWYESLGGKSRMEFFGPIDLLSNSAAKKTLEGLGCKSAVVGLSPDLSMAFVARNQAAASSAK
mmetsp:Transcript_39255/g.86102  ORF Transcript_39255/g.86102 Transcript_39255/m.86102 type:complete len:374 (-) Transcript_39255:402-1523(-)